MNDYLIKYKQDLLQNRALEIESEWNRVSYVTKSAQPVRHKCFISYHAEDIDAVTAFVEEFKDVFIPRVVGASDNDAFGDPVSSTDKDYIMRKIREKYLTDSTVTILFVGKCTSLRKYVDWELASTLRNDTNNKLSGLLAILPKYKTSGTLPDRFNDNFVSGDISKSYAWFYSYPSGKDDLRRWIQGAFDARTSKASLKNNSKLLRQRNGACSND
jgi:MTH538 TIR-like domain (DUF1863)